MGGGEVSVTRWVWKVMHQCYQMGVGGDGSVLPDGDGS